MNKANRRGRQNLEKISQWPGLARAHDGDDERREEHVQHAEGGVAPDFFYISHSLSDSRVTLDPRPTSAKRVCLPACLRTSARFCCPPRFCIRGRLELTRSAGTVRARRTREARRARLACRRKLAPFSFLHQPYQELHFCYKIS